MGGSICTLYAHLVTPKSDQSCHYIKLIFYVFSASHCSFLVLRLPVAANRTSYGEELGIPTLPLSLSLYCIVGKLGVGYFCFDSSIWGSLQGWEQDST